MNADGSNQRQLTFTDGIQDNQPTFSPDGRTIAWSGLTGSDATSEVFAMNADGSGQHQLTNDGVEQDGPSFSPNGSQMVFDQDPGTGTDNLAVMPATGGAITPLSTSTDQTLDPDWQPIPVDCGGLRSTLVGTEGPDTLIGTAGKDVISGLGGKDLLNGLQGNDVICGGPGKDKLKGGPGNDKLFGQAGKDTLSAGKGKKDRCVGGKGKDTTAGCEVKKGI
jgi:Ca2+-binding RTX toxin-like protein